MFNFPFTGFFQKTDIGMETKPAVSIKVMVEENKNRVVFAEAGNDFVDILFSFLTLPMGSINSILRKQTQQSQEVAQIGCLNYIYQSLESLSTTHFIMDASKDMLLNPRNPCEDDCRRLKVNVDQTKPLKYYICSDLACSRKENGGLLSNYNNVKCSCGKFMNREILRSDEHVMKHREENTDAVFLKTSTAYIISDNLKIIPSSPGALLQFLSDAGIKDVNCLLQRHIVVGYDEVLHLLKRSLLSVSPLTEVFCSREASYSKSIPSELRFCKLPSKEFYEYSNARTQLKILLQKSNNKVLYAEASEDFGELLFSFLITPLAKVVRMLEGRSFLGCVDNLYRSVLTLLPNLQKYFLFAPGMIDQGYLKQFKKKYCCCTKLSIWRNEYSLSLEECCFARCNSGHVLSPLCLIDPESPTGIEGEGKYLKRPARFLVSDNLEVKPWLPSTSSISILNDLSVPIGDIEERVITFSNQEAWILLRESLLTHSALTNFVYFVSKKTKIESGFSKLKL